MAVSSHRKPAKPLLSAQNFENEHFNFFRIFFVLEKGEGGFSICIFTLFQKHDYKNCNMLKLGLNFGFSPVQCGVTPIHYTGPPTRPLK